MRHTNSNGNPRWYVYIALVIVLLVAGYTLQACAGLLTPAHAAPLTTGVNVKTTTPRPGWSHIFGDWYHVEGVTSKAALATLPNIAAVEDDPVAVISADPLQAQQYHLARINATGAWPVAQGAGVTIAVLDTGVNCAHEDLVGHCTGDADDHGHGTHVAGIVAATAGNGRGGVGVAYAAAILSIKVLDANGSGSFSRIAAGLTKAADMGAQVANMSLGCVGTQCDSQMMREAVAYAHARGVVVVVAAGNHGTSAPSYPALYAFSVAATDQSDRLASFSAWGDWVDVSAPGVGITSTYRDGTYGQMSGTSMASPVVAGVAALVRQACQACSVSQIEDRLRDGDPVDTPRLVGKRVNAYVAVGRSAPPVATHTPLPPLPTATPPAPNSGDGELVKLINEERARQGLPPFALDARLTQIARQHNQAMNGCAMDDGWTETCFGHNVPGEPDVCARFASVGMPCGGEVIGQGYVDAAAMVAGWLGSSGHRAILLGNFTAIGCAADSFSDSWEGKLYTCDTASVAVVRTATPAPTPRPQLPPAGWVMRVEARPSAGWGVWDALYLFCNKVGVACSWYRSP